MASHLAHRLPWASLGDVVKFKSTPTKGGGCVDLEPKHEKVIAHFARCFTDALQEFAASDKSPDEERRKFDATTWEIDSRGFGGYMDYYTSLLRGYFQLNLILMDPKEFTPIVLREGQSATWVMKVLCRGCDGGHPEWIASHLRGAFDERFHLKPLTAEALQILRDHCALLFRALYSISGDNHALDPAFAERHFTPSFY